jgi:uncharacterized membrane-anchored protein YitT (DUF2179 family)
MVSNDISYKRNKIKMLKDYIFIIVGSVIAAAGMDIFLIPNKIAPGGVSGIATVIFHLSGGGIPAGVVMLVINIPLLIIGAKYIGKKFLIRTLVGTILLSIIVDIFQPFAGSFAREYLTNAGTFHYPSDYLLYSVFGGFFMGAGLGLVFKSGATTGGSDLAAKIINHFMPNFTISQILLFIDAGIVIFAAIVFKSFIIGLYSIVTIFIMSKAIDVMLEGVNFVKAAYIISAKPDEIAKKILHDMERGVTALKGRGMYTGQDKEVLMCILERAQIAQIKQIVKSIDPEAFVVLADVREVLGEGFNSYE